MMHSIDSGNALVTTRDLTKDTHNEHLQITRDWILMFSAIGAASIVLVTLVTLAVTASAPLWLVLPLLTGFGFACVLAMVALRALEYARYCVQERFNQWAENQITAREIARIQAAQITNVQVRGRSNVVSVNSAGAGVESVRLVGVNVNRTARMVDGVDERDLIYFCERAPIVGHVKRAWLGATLPSGKVITTFEDYNQMIAPLLKAGCIVGRGERSAGKLIGGADELKAALGLPSGVQRGETIEGTAQEVL